MKIKNVFDKFISEFDTTEKKINETKGRSTEIIQLEMSKVE